MQSRRALGITALGAVVVSAISFAVVDVSIANANGCLGSAAVCSDRTVPTVAITFAVLGALSLLISIVPAFSWFMSSLRLARTDDSIDESDLEVSRLAVARRRGFDEDEA